MTLGGSIGLGPCASTRLGGGATAPAALSSVRRVNGLGAGIEILRAKRRCTNRRLLYHLHPARAPHVPAGPIAEVWEQGLRAHLALGAIGEDFQLAALEPGREVDRQRLAPAASRKALTQHERVAEIEEEREDHERRERAEDGEHDAPAASLGEIARAGTTLRQRFEPDARPIARSPRAPGPPGNTASSERRPRPQRAPLP